MSGKAPRSTRKVKITFKLTCFRVWDDPNFKGARGMQGFVRVTDMPQGCNLAPNVRVQYTKSKVFRELKQAMLNEDPQGKDALHLGCLGITFITTRADFVESGNDVEVVVNNKGMFSGIVNGGHVNLAACLARSEMLQLIGDGKTVEGDRQLIPIKILEGTPRNLRTYIARAQNRTMQVEDEALLYSEGVFDKIESQLQQDGVLHIFGRKGNETKVDKDKIYKIGYNLRLLECFLVDKYPDGSGSHPRRVAVSPGRLVSDFERPKNQIRYDKVLHLLRDFWVLFEVIRSEAWEAFGSRIKPAVVHFVEERKKSTPVKFPFIDVEKRIQLGDISGLAWLAAFRQYLAYDANEDRYEWDRPFAEMLVEVRTLLKPMFKEARVYVGKEAASSKTKDLEYWDKMYKLVQIHLLKQKVPSGNGKAQPPKKRKTSAKRKNVQRRLNLRSL